MLALLLALDLAFRALWHPHPSRLPEQFSPAYLDAYVRAERDRHPVVVLGDSALWGYHLAAGDAAVARLAALRPGVSFLNLTYEGGSIVNSVVGLRLALARGVRPSAVIVNVNSKEFNPADSAYNRLQPSLERAAGTLLTPQDRALLTLLPPPTLADRLDAAISRIWAVYAQRVDIRVAIFGVDDAAGLLAGALHRMTGETARYDRLHRPTPAAFVGTYDLEPPAADNVELHYLRDLRTLLERERIPTVAFLTPTNHRLLHDTLDDGTYDGIIHGIAAVLRAPSIRVVDLDRLAVGSHFIDNDHLDAAGSRLLARRLARELDTVRR